MLTNFKHNRTMKNLFLIFCLGMFVVASVGCSSNVSVSGKVTFSDDNSAVPFGIICFDNGTFLARGSIKDGTYVMGSVSETDGIPPGEYRVYFIGTDAVVGYRSAQSGEEPDPKYAPFVAQQFLSASTSGLTAKIDGKTTNLDFKVDRDSNFPKDKALVP
jgi:hypothetical protein